MRTNFLKTNSFNVQPWKISYDAVPNHAKAIIFTAITGGMVAGLELLKGSQVLNFAGSDSGSFLINLALFAFLGLLIGRIERAFWIDPFELTRVSTYTKGLAVAVIITALVLVITAIPVSANDLPEYSGIWAVLAASLFAGGGFFLATELP